MSAITLLLLSSTEKNEVTGVTSFVGEDASGIFGILPGRSRMMTSLVFGLARFRVGNEPWQYLALPGALLYFVDNRLQICTHRYLIDADYDHISALLQEQLLAEEEGLKTMRRSLHRMEEQIMRRLWDLGRHNPLQE